MLGADALYRWKFQKQMSALKGHRAFDILLDTFPSFLSKTADLHLQVGKILLKKLFLSLCVLEHK